VLVFVLRGIGWFLPNVKEPNEVFLSGLLLGFPALYFVSILSWHLIEAPMIQLGRRLSSHPRAQSVTAQLKSGDVDTETSAGAP
jgi:peptidoglycan/LPS O-acetylase OafA/YrhL